MSNQIGLVLSFFFLAILLCFSFELIGYENINARLNEETLEIANHIQKYGLEADYIDLVKSSYQLDDIKINKESYDLYSKYNIEISKNYTSSFDMFSFVSKEITVNASVIRKE